MKQLAVGLMSGTSADGVDAALVEISADGTVVLKAFCTRDYTLHETANIRDTIAEGGAGDLARLNVELGAWFAEAVEMLLSRAGCQAADIDFVASHGHTIWHAPGGVTLQLGEPAVIAERIGVRVVSDFRSRDVAAGGQGAPLVPIADLNLFAGDSDRVLVNIGGIANVTWVPATRDPEAVVAFDTGPGMSLTDTIVRERFPGERFDEGGRRAAAGTVVDEVVNRLSQDRFFQLAPPKSTGRELFGDQYARALCSRVREFKPGAAPEDYIATAVEFTARTITEQFRWLPGVPGQIVVSGGGGRNATLLNRIRQLNAPIDLALFDDIFFDGDAKEAVVFAYLGWLCLRGEPGNLPGVTGAVGPRVLGRITPS